MEKKSAYWAVGDDDDYGPTVAVKIPKRRIEAKRASSQIVIVFTAPVQEGINSAHRPLLRRQLLSNTSIKQ